MLLVHWLALFKLNNQSVLLCTQSTLPIIVKALDFKNSCLCTLNLDLEPVDEMARNVFGWGQATVATLAWHQGCEQGKTGRAEVRASAPSSPGGGFPAIFPALLLTRHSFAPPDLLCSVSEPSTPRLVNSRVPTVSLCGCFFLFDLCFNFFCLTCPCFAWSSFCPLSFFFLSGPCLPALLSYCLWSTTHIPACSLPLLWTFTTSKLYNRLFVFEL